MSGREKRKETEKTFFLSELIWLPTDIHCLCRTQTLPFSNVKSFTMIGSWCIKRKVCHWSVPEQDAVTTCWELAARFKKRAFKSSVQRIWCFLLQSYRTPTCSFIHVFNTGLNNMSTAHHSSEGKKPTDQLLKLTLKEVSRRDINKVSWTHDIYKSVLQLESEQSCDVKFNYPLCSRVRSGRPGCRPHVVSVCCFVNRYKAHLHTLHAPSLFRDILVVQRQTERELQRTWRQGGYGSVY